MISDRFYIVLYIFANTFSYFGFAPVSFSLKTKLFSKSTRGLTLLKFHVCPVLIWLNFVIIQSFRFHQSGDLDSFNLCVTCIFMGLMSVEVFLVLIFFSYENLSFINSLLLFLRHVNKVYMPIYNPNRELNTKLFELVIVILLVGLSGMGGLSCLYFLFYPMSPCLIGSVFPQTTFLPFRLFMLYLFPQYLTFSMLSTALITLTGLMIYGLIAVPFMVKELRMDKKTYISKCQLRTPSNLILVYRSSQILQTQMLNIVEYIIVPSQAIVTNVILFSSVMLIKQGYRMSMASKGMLGSWGIICTIGWTVVLMIWGYMHWYGKKLLDSWKYHQWPTKRDRALMSKFRKSCKPLRMQFGRTYVIRRLSVLKFLRSISRGIFRALLTFDSKRHSK